MHKNLRYWTVPLCLALLLATTALAAQPDFVTQSVNAELGEERDASVTGKVAPLEDTFELADGRIRVIVQLEEPPVALYDGSSTGLAATRPDLNGARKLDMNSSSVAAYRDDIGKIAKMPGVKKVFPDRMYFTTMDASLDLINAPAIWAELGGRDNAGAGVKVAVVDGGIRPDNPMFDGTNFSYPPGYPLADDYCGTVDPSFCNGKLIVARHFRTVPLHPDEFDSPLGANGHGTHVSGTAVGNFVAGATAPDGVPENISGVAPGAWLLAYKALWWNGTTGSGSTTDLIAAIEAAVEDGADVINHSYGGGGGEDPNTDAFGPVFEASTAAGVLNVVAAGNSGPGATTIGCPGCQPEALTVANSTTNRLHALGFDLTGGPAGLACLEGTGPTLGATVGPEDVVYAGDVGDPVGCVAFPPGSMTGAIALISRGGCTFATKAANAAAAGANFMVVFNSAAGAPITMGGLGGSTISSCMISNDQGIAARDFVQSNPGADGQVNYPAERLTDDLFADNMSSSSSRGPNGDPDILKPDIAAPGTRIMSAWSPDDPRGGSEFTLINGTSMASPHVAGAAALVIQQHPDWTPEQVKSALTSTAVQVLVKEDAATPADPFDRGAPRPAGGSHFRPGFDGRQRLRRFLQLYPDHHEPRRQ